MRVIVSREARESLKAISAYLSQYSPAAARRTRFEINARIKTLPLNPRKGRKVPEYDVDAIREVIEGDYRIWYRLSHERIEIIAIFHGARGV